MPLFKREQDTRPVNPRDPVLMELRQRVLELEGQLNREALAAARDLTKKDEQIAALRRELDTRTRRIVFLEGEMERLQTEFYKASAEAAERAARERRIRELAAEGKPVTAIANEVFDYNGGWGWHVTKQVVKEAQRDGAIPRSL